METITNEVEVTFLHLPKLARPDLVLREVPLVWMVVVVTEPSSLGKLSQTRLEVPLLAGWSSVWGRSEESRVWTARPNHERVVSAATIHCATAVEFWRCTRLA